MSNQPVSYLQTDPRWKNIPYAVKGEGTTIGGSGCGPTSMAMVLATWCDPKVTPATECAWALKNGYKAYQQGTYYSYFVPAAKRYGLICTQVNSASIYGNANHKAHGIAKGAVDSGDLVIACMGKGLWTSSGHFVLVWKIEGNMIYINDPASTKMARTHGNYLVFKKEVKYYWIIRKPITAPKEKPKEDEFPMDKTEAKNYIKSEVADQLGILKDEKFTADNADEPKWSQLEGWWQKATDMGIVDGTQPERPAKRDEIIAILGRLGLIPYDASDVTSRH